MPPLDIDLAKLIQQVELDLPDSTPLTKVSEAQQRARLLNEIGDQLVDYYVTAARDTGAPWSHVGDALGVTKQAAQQKWVPSIFHRFTDRSRAVIVVAQERARTLRHDAVAPAHLLLALADSDGLSAALLADRGVTAAALSDALADALQPGTTRPPAVMPFTIEAKRAWDAAAMTAVALGHNFVGTEHLLLGLFTARDRVTDQALAALHLTEDDVRSDIARRMPPTSD
jgi:Clp amino terminal domain, pathogenicity island component